MPRAAPSEPPAWFDAQHRAVWDERTREIEHMLGNLYAADLDVLVVFVCAVVRHEIAAPDIMARG